MIHSRALRLPNVERVEILEIYRIFKPSMTKCFSWFFQANLKRGNRHGLEHTSSRSKISFNFHTWKARRSRKRRSRKRRSRKRRSRTNTSGEKQTCSEFPNLISFSHNFWHSLCATCEPNFRTERVLWPVDERTSEKALHCESRSRASHIGGSISMQQKEEVEKPKSFEHTDTRVYIKGQCRQYVRSSKCSPSKHW